MYILHSVRPSAVSALDPILSVSPEKCVPRISHDLVSRIDWRTGYRAVLSQLSTYVIRQWRWSRLQRLRIGATWRINLYVCHRHVTAIDS